MHRRPVSIDLVSTIIGTEPEDARGAPQTKELARAEFVMGRILAAKGDTAGAREHIAKYLALSPKTPDAELIQGYLGVIGKPEAAGVNPDLELP